MQITDIKSSWIFDGYKYIDFPITTQSSKELLSGICVIICTYNRPISLKRFLDSLASQSRQPDKLLIIDASHDDNSEVMLKNYKSINRLAKHTQYVHVTGELVGLTRQRNFGIRYANRDLTAFFDDDIVLSSNCLHEMEKVHTFFGEQVAGVSAYICSETPPPLRIWKIRRFLRMVSSLTPGKYDKSGMSIPWFFLPIGSNMAMGDWLPGGTTMWKTKIVREIGFNEHFIGYAQGEDLDFSLRARSKGKLLMITSAKVKHLHDQHGRPNPLKIGYMAIYNRYKIHCRNLSPRRKLEAARFIYTWTLDTVFLLRNLYKKQILVTSKEIIGRILGFIDIFIFNK